MRCEGNYCEGKGEGEGEGEGPSEHHEPHHGPGGHRQPEGEEGENYHQAHRHGALAQGEAPWHQGPPATASHPGVACRLQ